MEMIMWVPTFLFIICVIGGLLTGLRRGFRKSLILLITMVLSMILSMVSFFVMKQTVHDVNVSYLFDQFELSTSGVEGTTLNHFVIALIEERVPNLAPIMAQPMAMDIIQLFVGFVTSLIFFLITWLILYHLFKALFYLFYLILFKEGRRKRRLKEEGEAYSKHRLLGGLVGSIRGMIIGFLIFSCTSTMIYFVTGAVEVAQPQTVANKPQIEINGMDITELYNQLLATRKTGLGTVFESMKINGSSIDYLFLDSVLSHDFTDIHDKKVTVNFRKEIGMVTKILKKLFDAEVINFTTQTFHPDKLMEYLTQEELSYLFDMLSESKLLTSVGMKLFASVVQAAQDGTLVVSQVPKSVFDVFSIEMLQNIDLAKDIQAFAEIVDATLSLVNHDYEELKDLTNMNLSRIFTFEAETVKRLFNTISQMDLMTQLAVPVGIAFFNAHTFNNWLDNVVLNPNSIMWDKDMQTLGNLYEMLQSLELSEKMFGAEAMDELKVLVQDELKLEKANQVVQMLFDSDFVFEVTKSMMREYQKYLAASSEESLLKQVLAYIDLDAAYLTKEMLKDDLSVLVHGMTELNALIAFSIENAGKAVTIDELLNVLDPEVLSRVIIGEEGRKGIIDLQLLKGKEPGAENAVIGELLSTVLTENITGLNKQQMAEIDWRQEVKALSEGIRIIIANDIKISDLINDFTKIPQIGVEETDQLVDSITNSTVLSHMLIQTIENADEGILAELNIPEDIQWLGENGELKPLLRGLFVFINQGNLSEIMSNDQQTMLQALSELKPDGNTDGIARLAGSSIITGLLEKQIKNMMEEQNLGTLDFTDLNWEQELSTFVDVLNMGILRDEENKIKIEQINSLGVITKATESDIDILSNSKIILMALETVIKKVEVNGVALVLPEHLVWNQELKTLRQILLIPALQKEETNEPDLNKLQELHIIAGLQEEEVDYFAHSRLLMENIPHILKSFHSSTENFKIYVPEEIVWGNTDDSKGEFARLVFVLHEAQQALGSDLTMDNLVKGIIKMETYHTIVESKVLSRTIVNQLITQSSETGDLYHIVFIPAAFQEVEYTAWYQEGDAELERILYFIKALGFEDLEQVDLNNSNRLLSEDTQNLLIDSKVMSYTAVNQVINMTSDSGSLSGTFVIPSQLRDHDELAWQGSDGELAKLFQSLRALFGAEAILSEITGEMPLTDIYVNRLVLVESAIITQTIFSNLNKVDRIIISNLDKEIVFGDETITKNATLSLLESVHILGITHLTNLELEITTIIEKEMSDFDIILNSGIVHTTISPQLLEQETVKIPMSIVGERGDKTIVIKSELLSLIRVMKELNLVSFSDLEMPFDKIAAANVATLTNSVIVRAAISSELLQTNDIVIPETKKYQETRYVVSGATPIIELIDQIELIQFLLVLKELGFTEYNAASFEVSQLADNESLEQSLNQSLILRATVSNKILGIASLEIPNMYRFGNDIVREEQGIIEAYDQAILITTSEIVALMKAFQTLGGNLDGASVDLGALQNEQITLMMKSAIVSAIFSKQLVERASLSIPEMVKFESSKAQNELEQLTLIYGEELHHLLIALRTIGASEFDQSVIIINATLIDNMPIILASKILHSTISAQIFAHPDLNSAILLNTVETLGTQEVLTQDEIIRTATAMNKMGKTSFEETFDYTALLALTEEDRAIILDSQMVRVFLSGSILNGALGMPYHTWHTLNYPGEAATIIEIVKDGSDRETITKEKMLEFYAYYEIMWG